MMRLSVCKWQRCCDQVVLVCQAKCYVANVKCCVLQHGPLLKHIVPDAAHSSASWRMYASKCGMPACQYLYKSYGVMSSILISLPVCLIVIASHDAMCFASCASHLGFHWSMHACLSAAQHDSVLSSCYMCP